MLWYFLNELFSERRCGQASFDSDARKENSEVGMYVRSSKHFSVYVHGIQMAGEKQNVFMWKKLMRR